MLFFLACRVFAYLLSYRLNLGLNSGKTTKRGLLPELCRAFVRRMSEREVVRVFDCLCCVGSLRYFHLPLLAFDRFQRPEYGLCHAFLFAHGLVHLFCEALFEDVRIAVTLFPHFNGCEVQIHPFLAEVNSAVVDRDNQAAFRGSLAFEVGYETVFSVSGGRF